MSSSPRFGPPEKQGLYDPAYEHDSCGVGFVANIKGRRSHQIVQDAYTILQHMDHRGACGCDPNTGDGAGILTGLPYEFLTKVADQDLDQTLPPAGQFGAGLVFLPQLAEERERCKQKVTEIIAEQGQYLIGWRKVPQATESANVGRAAREAEPYIEQLFVGAGRDTTDRALEADAFERQLYLIRKRASHVLRSDPSLQQAKLFYFCSLSTQIMIYKGMLTTSQLFPYFPDLCDPDYQTHLAMVHSRFSTNTFPSWDRAQPNRFMSHNGEINTLRGNINWMRAREGVMQSDLFGEELTKVFPVMEPDCSDSGNFDNALEFLLQTGRTLQEAVMMMIPEAWQKHETMPEAKRAFYEFHSCLMEPWDGPASIAFTDGHYIGAVLDRNGLRPSRYYLTHDDRVIMASEVGVLPTVTPENVKFKGRLQPGRMFLVDFEAGRLIPDEELKEQFASNRPYSQWLREQRLTLDELVDQFAGEGAEFDPDSLRARMQAFGYTTETMQFMLLPLIREKRDPVGSMGNDSSLACLSDQSRMLYDYFKQLFAQVTNPAIDSIREEVIMSLECYIGPEQNLLETSERHCQRLLVPHPILTNRELGALKEADYRGWKTRSIDTTFPRSAGSDGIRVALDRICDEAEAAIDAGYSLLVLSDREIGAERVPLSALLACGAVHHHLVRQAKRTQIGLVVETGEAREVHHHCLLIGYGADAINPYLAFEALRQAQLDGLLEEEPFGDHHKIVVAYRQGVAKGMLKVMAKMGISTLQSYKGAQIFEAVGLKDEIIDRCFTHTPSRVQGVTWEVLASELLRRHALGYPEGLASGATTLPNPGEFHWRAEGERHMWDPAAIADLQVSTRGWSHVLNERSDTVDQHDATAPDSATTAYHRFADHANQDARTRCALRGLMQFKEHVNRGPIPIEEVEPTSEIVKRFCTGAMSFGSISSEAHETLAMAMNRLGGKSNTGEGGEDPVRIDPLANGDSKRSAIKQVASGRFGVTAWYLTNADELQIKISQGAKPGEGGELPGKKVDENIARIRCSTPGVGLISPPPHHDIYSIEDLAQLIHDLKNANPSARISVKLVSEIGVGTIAAGVAKGHADHILISGDAGGTGASPLTSIKHAGLPWELGIAETHQTLVLNDLRSRVVLQTDGGMKTGRDVVIAGLLGAEEIGFSTAPLITLGCIMMRKCHLNTCPVGIATQDPELRRKFAGSPDNVVNYFFLVAEEARQWMAQLGFRRFQDLIGRSDVLDMSDAIQHWKSDGIDLTPILRPAEKPREDTGVFCQIPQDHGLEHSLDQTQLLGACQAAIEDQEPVRIELPIVNTNRTVGTTLSHHVVRRWGEKGLPDGTIHIKFQGSAGQSFGAWLAAGLTLQLEGDGNDYVGKGLSGGRLIISPPPESSFRPEENIIIGNVALYGATSGEAFLRGRAAERFCVRNSGAHAVIEGVGDHGCEYMTGGVVVILGPVGRNFAAGMSGGVAYIWAPDRDAFRLNCNLGMVELEDVFDEADQEQLRTLLQAHLEHTGSSIAQRLLADWPGVITEFVKVMPTDYKRVLLERRQRDAKAEVTS